LSRKWIVSSPRFGCASSSFGRRRLRENLARNSRTARIAGAAMRISGAVEQRLIVIAAGTQNAAGNVDRVTAAAMVMPSRARGDEAPIVDMVTFLPSCARRCDEIA
jgi:hypothetical protein